MVPEPSVPELICVDQGLSSSAEGAGRTRSCFVAAAATRGRELIGGAECPGPGNLRKQSLSCSVHLRQLACSPASDPLAIGEKAGNGGWGRR